MSGSVTDPAEWSMNSLLIEQLNTVDVVDDELQLINEAPCSFKMKNVEVNKLYKYKILFKLNV